MCWAVPTRIVQIDGDVGRAEIDGAVREVGLCLIEDPLPGDYVLIHAGFAIQKVDEQEAQETLRLLDEMHRSLGERDEIR